MNDGGIQFNMQYRYGKSINDNKRGIYFHHVINVSTSIIKNKEKNKESERIRKENYLHVPHNRYKVLTTIFAFLLFTNFKGDKTFEATASY